MSGDVAHVRGDEGRIRKDVGALAVAPNVADYDEARAAFDWERARAALDGLPGGRGLNIAHEAVDRHARGGRRDHVALRWRGRRGEARDLTYADLASLTARFANVLGDLGLDAGDRVFLLSSRVPSLYVAALGALKARAVVCPLFAAFGPEPVRQRLEIGGGRMVVTTAALYRKKLAGIRAAVPELEHVLLVDEPSGPAPDGTVWLAELLDRADDRFEIPPTDPEDVALLHFTSGTTGTPKGALHVHEAVVAHHATARAALDLHPDDVFWCTADPGWVTGTSYGIVAPLVHGVTSVVDEGEYDLTRWLDLLHAEQVTVWYTAPTAIRRMMRASEAVRERGVPDSLRFVASVGEPLNPEAVRWGVDVLGRAIHDNWWQTETGGIMIANLAATDVKPGSMGRPLPGVDAAILLRDERGEPVVGPDGAPVLVTEDGVEGELALRTPWPSMFRGYLGQPERYRRCFLGPWYRTGDLVERDDDGWYWFVGRGDDVIKSSGHLIGPFEVESVLMEHPAVAEAGVIGRPDPVAGEVVKAFVLLRGDREPTDELRLELVGFGRTRLGAAVAPREIEFVDDLPKTRSGKIMRRLLKARELGLPEGDLSTLEEPA